jgi:dipeptidyl aminopeptidase/acylaminoacyl peptidase
VGAGDSGFELAGTLTLPAVGAPPYPAVITISGSGLQNRDEEICPLVVGYRPFRQIAERLAREGIAVLRVDDRMVGGSGGDATEATTYDFAEDVHEEIAWLRARPDIDPDRIALVGHSEGGVIAPMVVNYDPTVAALVLMAGTAKTGLEVLKYQVTYPILTAEGLSDEKKAELAADAIRQLETTPGQNAWLRYFRAYDPLPAAREVSQPVLILQGALDRQVTADQAEMLATALREGGNEDVEVDVYPDLNHLFLVSRMDGAPAEYMTLTDVDVPEYVLDRMAVWLAVRLAVD